VPDVGFSLSYVVAELSRRRSRAILTALGLAAGVGMFIALVGVSQGLTRAQDKVLSPLSSVGSDILVTRVAGSTDSSANRNTNGQQPSGGFFGGGSAFGGINQQDLNALAKDNASLVTDLSKLGKPGTHFTRDFFLPATLLTFPEQAVHRIAGLKGVTSAVGGLTLLATHQTGTVPKIVATLKAGGQSFTRSFRPPPLSASERAKIRDCFAKLGVTGGGGSNNGGPTGGGLSGPPPGGDSCLPKQFQKFTARFTAPLQTVQQVLSPPQTNIKSTSYTAAGVDASHPSQGSVTASQIAKGRFIKTSTEMLVSTAYANKNKVKVGDTMPVNGTNFTVVGLVNPTLSGQTADLYFPLGALQRLATQHDRVNMVLVSADSAADVPGVATEIQKLLPGAQVVTTKDLAGQVSGSLSDTKKLADRFGGVLATIVLLAAFAIAVLLTLSSVGKRVREIGTLRAIGWSKGRVVRQILAETAGIGVVGAVVGIGLGALAAVLVGHYSPSLSTSRPSVPGQTTSALAQFLPTSFGSTVGSTHVPLSVPLHASTILIGVALAIVGGILAGAIGGWRAARLAPAIALRDIG
jgi:putative ABC transport system permease protein